MKGKPVQHLFFLSFIFFWIFFFVQVLFVFNYIFCYFTIWPIVTKFMIFPSSLSLSLFAAPTFYVNCLSNRLLVDHFAQPNYNCSFHDSRFQISTLNLLISIIINRCGFPFVNILFYVFLCRFFGFSNVSSPSCKKLKMVRNHRTEAPETTSPDRRRTFFLCEKKLNMKNTTPKP